MICKRAPRYELDSEDESNSQRLDADFKYDYNKDYKIDTAMNFLIKMNESSSQASKSFTAKVLQSLHKILFLALSRGVFMSDEFNRLEPNEKEIALTVLKTKLSEQGQKRIYELKEDILILEDSDFIDLPHLR